MQLNILEIWDSSSGSWLFTLGVMDPCITWVILFRDTFHLFKWIPFCSMKDTLLLLLPYLLWSDISNPGEASSWVKISLCQQHNIMEGLPSCAHKSLGMSQAQPGMRTQVPDGGWLHNWAGLIGWRADSFAESEIGLGMLDNEFDNWQ